MSEITASVLRQRLESIGLSVDPVDEAGVLEFTQRILREGQAVGAAVAPNVGFHPLFAIADPDVYMATAVDGTVQPDEKEKF